MPRWMPRSGPSSEVSHHIDLPRRRAAVSVRPVSAARSSPGECGRQTNVSLSSTSVMRRCSASSAIRRRAVSTSGSSGIPSFLQVPVIAIVKIRHFVAPVYRCGAGLHTGSSRIFSRRGAGMLKLVIVVLRRLPGARSGLFDTHVGVIGGSDGSDSGRAAGPPGNGRPGQVSGRVSGGDGSCLAVSRTVTRGYGRRRQPGGQPQAINVTGWPRAPGWTTRMSPRSWYRGQRAARRRRPPG